MYTVYLQRTTVERRHQIVHHRSLDLKKPAVRLSQFQEYPTQALLEFVNFRNPRAVDTDLSSRVFPGILDRDQFVVYSSGKNAGEEEKPSSCLKSVREIWRMTR